MSGMKSIIDNKTFQTPLGIIGGIVLANLILPIVACSSALGPGSGADLVPIVKAIDIGAVLFASVLSATAITRYGICNDLRDKNDLSRSRRSWVIKVWAKYALCILLGSLLSGFLYYTTANIAAIIVFFPAYLLCFRIVRETSETFTFKAMVMIGLAIAILSSLFLVIEGRHETSHVAEQQISQEM